VRDLDADGILRPTLNDACRRKTLIAAKAAGVLPGR